MGIAEASQFIIDEFTSVIRVQDWEQQVAQDCGESSKDIHLCTAGNGDDLCPSRTTIGDGEGITVVFYRLSPVMAGQIHLHIPGEFPEGGDRDKTQEAPGLGPGTVLPVAPFSFSTLSRRSMVTDPI
jgi:hypothetical protein